MNNINSPLVVNLFAAPGSGKSTMAAGVFYKLKNNGINVELAGEYAKDLVWSGRQRTLEDQIYVFGKQHHRIQRLQQDCDVIIADSPILLGLAYAADYPQCFKDTVYWAFNQYNNINFLLKRTKPYNHKGRNQNEFESDQKQEEIIDLLLESRISFDVTTGDEQGLDYITLIVMNKINND